MDKHGLHSQPRDQFDQGGENARFLCVKCNTFLVGFKNFQVHLRHIDHIQPFKCGQNGCESDFLHRKSLYEHIKTHHWQQAVRAEHAATAAAVAEDQGWFVNAQPDLNVPAPLCNESNSDTSDNGGLPDQEDIDFAPPGAASPEDETPVNLENSAKSVVLNLRSVTYMTGTAIQAVEDQCYTLAKDVASHLKQKVVHFLSNPEKTVDDVNRLLSEFSLSDLFHGLKTKDYGLLEPKQIFLGARLDSRQHPRRPRLEAAQVPNSFQYVSMKDILKSLMSDDCHRNLIVNEQPSKDGFMRSFLDGSLYPTLPPDLKDALRVVLYIDDLELLQALSARAGVYKVAGIYFGVQNLQAEFNALLTYIFVTALAFAEDAKSTLVWEPFLNDTRELENVGEQIIVHGEPSTFKAVLIAQIGDTLAAHDVLGFVSPASAVFCRSCYIRRPEMWGDGLKVGFPRTRESHASDVAASRNVAARKASGVAGPPLIQGLRFFRPELCSIFDPFHDMPQGINKMEVKLGLREYVCIKNT